MSYPEPRYHGEQGATSAWLRPAGGEPDLRLRSDVEVHYLATGDRTQGDFGLYRWEMSPAAGGASPHFHRGISESFYVLSGQVQLFDGREWTGAGAGDFLHVPPGGVHGFRNESGSPASMLILFTPGAPREDYFETLADAARREAMDDEARAAFFLRHDTFWVERN